MAFRLCDLVVGGFFMNSHRLSTHGRLLLRGAEMPIVVELTGDPDPDLRGRRLEFEVPGNDREASDEDRRLVAQLRTIQIGVTGEMTAGRKVRTFDCSFEEFNRRCELGEPPPTRWELCLYLEWYSQNGRVVIELPMSKIRLLSDAEIEARDQAEKESFEAEMRRLDEKRQGGESTTPESDELFEEDDITPPYPISIPQTEDEEEGYGLIPDELDAEFERQARRMDREVAGDSENTIKMKEETELMDDMLERGKQTPLKEFLADLKLPSPSALSTEEQAEQYLKLALMKLALAGIAYHVCEHCSAREAYRIFIDRVCEESGAYPQLSKTNWVQNVCASDYCEKCMGEDAV